MFNVLFKGIVVLVILFKEIEILLVCNVIKMFINKVIFIDIIIKFLRCVIKEEIFLELDWFLFIVRKLNSYYNY